MLQYRFTSGVHAVAGGTPWDTGRTGVFQDAIPATRLAMYDSLATAMEAVGYERFERKTAGASVTQATRDDVWVSTGEDGKKNICIRTAIHAASGAAGTQYLSVLIGAKRDNAATALSGTWTWNGTTTVASTNTGQVRIGSYIRLNSNGQWFRITNIVANTNVTIVSGGFTIPSGATGSSVLTPNLEGDVGNSALGNTAPFNSDVWRWDLTAVDFSADYQLLLSKDFVHFVLQNVAHTGSMYVMSFGDLLPLSCNPNTMELSTTVAAGEFVELITLDPATGSAVDPIALGYRPLDRVRICNVDPQGLPRAETQVIVRVQSDRITVRRLRFGYDGRNVAVNPQRMGARIGMNVQPVFLNLSVNVELELVFTTNHFRTIFYQDNILDGVDPLVPGRTQGDLISSPSVRAGEVGYFTHYAQLTTHAQNSAEYGSGVTPNNRTLRFTIRSLAFGWFNSVLTNGGSIIGKVPRLATYNGSVTFYPHDNMKRDRVTPNEDFVPFRYTSASARNYLLGPTPGP